MDAWSSIYGSGVVRPGQGAEISGTSEIVGLLSASPGSAEGVISFPPVRGRYLHAGGTQAGGDALRWIAGVLGMSIPQALAAAAAVEPQPLVFLPHLAGERAPLWNADARAVFLGMTTQHDARPSRARRPRRRRPRRPAPARVLRTGGRLTVRRRCASPVAAPASELWNQIKRRRPPLRPRTGGEHDDRLPRRSADGRRRRRRRRRTSSRGPPTSSPSPARSPPTRPAPTASTASTPIYRSTYRALEERFVDLRVLSG